MTKPLASATTSPTIRSWSFMASPLRCGLRLFGGRFGCRLCARDVVFVLVLHHRRLARRLRCRRDAGRQLELADEVGRLLELLRLGHLTTAEAFALGRLVVADDHVVRLEGAVLLQVDERGSD